MTGQKQSAISPRFVNAPPRLGLIVSAAIFIARSLSAATAPIPGPSPSAAPEFDLHVFLNAGKHESIIYTSDLTEEYVEFNKGNVADPNSLGG